VRSLIAFFALTFALAWSAFIAVAALSPSTSSVPGITDLRWLLYLPGVFAPALVAIGLTASADGRAGVSTLLRRMFEWQVAPRWFAFAIGYMAAIKLTVAVLHRVITRAWPPFGDAPWYTILAAILISTPFQAGEEIGWRGYALPRLAARFGLAPASLLLGVIWAAWHLPLFFIPESDTYGQSFVVYALLVTPLSVAIAWLYAHTKGSLLLPMLLHAAANNSRDIVLAQIPNGMNTFGLHTSRVAWLTAAVLWVGAAYFLIRMPTLQSQPNTSATYPK
jgi:membrane protease YdiL (CAAX protease family)